MLKKTKYAAANLIAPGVGQLAMKKWIRGFLFLIASIAACVWMLLAFITTVVKNYQNAVNGNELHIDYIGILLPMIFLVLLWIYTYIDLFLFCTFPEKKSNNEDSATSFPHEKGLNVQVETHHDD